MKKILLRGATIVGKRIFRTCSTRQVKMVKPLLTTLCFFITLCAVAAVGNSAGVGITIIKDGYSCYILHITPDSPAARAGLKEGTEIIKIDGKDTKKHTVNEIATSLKGEKGSKVNLRMSTGRKNNNIELTRDDTEVKFYENMSNPEFIHYWSQVSPSKFPGITYLRGNDKYGKSVKTYIFVNNYWVERREKFEPGFEGCKAKPEDEQAQCFSELLARERNKTNADLNKMNMANTLGSQQIYYNKQTPTQNVQMIKENSYTHPDGTIYLMDTVGKNRRDIEYQL